MSVKPFVLNALKMNSESIPELVAVSLTEINAIELRVDPDNFFEWSSGIMSPIYCDNRLVYSFPKERDTIVSAFLKRIEDVGMTKDGVPVRPFTIAGVASGGIGWASILGHELGLPSIYVRPEPKKHGKGNQIEGYFNSDTEVLVIEDLFSTGGSSVRAVQAVIDEGCVVHHCISVFTYGFPVVDQKFADLTDHCMHSSLSDFTTLLKVANLSEETESYLLEWAKDPSSFKP